MDAAAPIDLTALANRYGSDKGDAVRCAHRYTRVYEMLLRRSRTRPLRVLEIGLIHGGTQNERRGQLDAVGCPSLRMWADYLPAACLFGFDIEDFSALAGERMTIVRGDQGNRDDLARMARECGGDFDLIVDDGSHASHHQQITLGALFPFLAPGGVYCIEDLHYQPAELELHGITPTREFLRNLRFGRTGARVALTQAEIGVLAAQLRAVLFFDSASDRWPLARLEDALAVLVKQGAHPVLDLSDVFGEAA